MLGLPLRNLLKPGSYPILPQGNLLRGIVIWSGAARSLVQSRARSDWAYEFPDRTGPDTQICRTGLNPDFHFYKFHYTKKQQKNMKKKVERPIHLLFLF